MVLESIRYVDEIITEDSWEQKAGDIRNHSIDLLVMGDDWMGKFDTLKDLCEVVYVPRTKGISTSMLKAKLTLSKDEEVSLEDD